MQAPPPLPPSTLLDSCPHFALVYQLQKVERPVSGDRKSMIWHVITQAYKELAQIRHDLWATDCTD